MAELATPELQCTSLTAEDITKESFSPFGQVGALFYAIMCVQMKEIYSARLPP
jgi:hypothetical protein